MSDDEKEDGPPIYQVETIPPPDGEDDAYSAPTKVGPMADAAVRELMQAAERRAAELSARLAEKKAASAAKVAASLPTPISTVKPTLPLAHRAPNAPLLAATPAVTAPVSSASPPAPSSTPAAAAAAAASTMPPPVVPGANSARFTSSGPVGRSVPSAPPLPKSPSSGAPKGPVPEVAPRSPAVPRAEVIATPPPIPAPPPLPPPSVTPRAVPVLPTAPASDPWLPSPPESAPSDPNGSLVRLYDEKDVTDDEATLLHKTAGPPRQLHTALRPSAQASVQPPPPVFPSIPSTHPSAPSALANAPSALANTPSNRPREPIPFDRPIAGPMDDQEPEPPRVLLMPLLVGFLIFAIGLGFYIWAR